ncbi:MAG: hypothetical protein L0332_16075 [Chloroflexi bacterium]|nr:hypothetical protein [Chloroflexota bacterium]MCI0580588.1 hypothetical protein [Chloroflexota bacterium]MCI0648890.1 hypothetical protein [Chloroflexota bacterium]MCI0728220.1 hypothetical protein [Chloroflexota bacterium]
MVTVARKRLVLLILFTLFTAVAGLAAVPGVRADQPIVAPHFMSQAFQENIPCLGGQGELRFTTRGITIVHLDEAGVPTVTPKHAIKVTFQPDDPALPDYAGHNELNTETFTTPTFVFEEPTFTFYQFDVFLTMDLRGSDNSRVTIEGPVYSILVLVFDDGSVTVGSGGNSDFEYTCLG